jgi:hypothetical protein
LKIGGGHSALEVIKELLFSTKKSLYTIYREVCTGNNLDFDGFLLIVNRYSNQVLSEHDIKNAFFEVCASL